MSVLTVCDLVDLEHAAGVRFGPFHRKWLLDRAPAQVQRDLRMAALHPNLIAAKQGFASTDAADAAPANLAAAINTTTTETNLWNPGLWGLIPAFDMRPGKSYVVRFGGVMGTTATPTIAWRARCGTNNSAPPTGTDLGISPTVTLGTFTAQPFYGQFELIVRSIGVAASGATVTGNGFVCMPAAAAATVVPQTPFGGAIPTTVDDKSNQGLGVSITWGASSASNTLTCQWMIPVITN
jgi:hypothetical protein